MTLVRSWLVQRLCKPVSSTLGEAFSFGGGYKNGGLSDEAMSLLRPIFSFDYMGAAEYEFGKVAETIFEIAKNSENYSVSDCVLPEGTVYFFCKTADIEAVHQRVLDIRNQVGDGRTRDITGMSNAFIDTSKLTGWLELDNHFIVFKNKEDMDKFVALFQES